MYMKNWQKFWLAVIGCELVGIIGAFFTTEAIPTWYASLNKPPFSPPNYLFGPVWTLLYFLMAVSFYLLWIKKENKKVMEAKNYFLIQLAVNFVWSPVFFGLQSPEMALVVILVMWWLILMTIRKFYALSPIASYLLVPYLLWVSFATVLNFSIAILN